MATSSDLDSDSDPAFDVVGAVHSGSGSERTFEYLDGQCLRSLLDRFAGYSVVVNCEPCSVVRADDRCFGVGRGGSD